MADLKTRVNDESVEGFLEGFPEDKRKDCFTLLEMMKTVTNNEPKMWGTSIIGFGDYHYEYKSGREGDFFLTGFSPRKQNLTLYINGGFDQYAGLLEKLGKYNEAKIAWEQALAINKNQNDLVIALQKVESKNALAIKKYPIKTL